ncbi:MOSC domain-containing protein [Zhongshania marina]|uniref:MOSC domain-containing protein n=1 Tax=Zhongshania marina TaxID=2304603 RepID=A0A2S4HGH3_9GAMM|nr:MOSC N-terminal beta barrel domain-containing protein [Marortus luteolus]POP53030.1 MOSC domain-containing protein [Marortus luteolus]
MDIRVSSLWRYPVKSMAGASMPSLAVTDWGPNLDRRWMVIDSQKRFITQRQLPRMCRLSASLSDAGIRIQSLDEPSLFIDVPEPMQAPQYEVAVWSDNCAAMDAGDEVATWLSDILGKSLRLCFMAETTHRQVDTQFAELGSRVSFADGFPFLLCSEASLAVLSKALGRGLAVQRFRPNIVVAGSEAFAEDEWRRIRIANIEFDVLKPCSRCAIPTVNLDTAEREADVFKMLRAERSKNGEVYFGQNLVHRGSGELAVGQRVEVLE